MATTPRGMNVTEAYRSFREGFFIVNRTYQRKLVWTLEEKVKLIDSIIKKYPIPLILLVQIEGGFLEIIDGMQRLNAIFSFIENDYHLNDDRYFDVAEFAFAREMADNGLFQPAESMSKLTRAECATVLDYQLAVTIFSVTDESDVTDIFGRINSGGKQLSPQEQRQAGVVTPFAAFVRRLSSELRGDASAETVNLADMPLVSVDAPLHKLGYGVHAEETFWCKQGVLRTKELRDSYDEQVVADLTASILLDEPFAVSRERLDLAYDTQNDLHTDLNNRLAAYPEELLANEIKTTFSALIETIEAADNSPNTFRRTVNPAAGGNPVRTPFYAVFMAYFQLVVRDQKQPIDPEAILNSLNNLAATLETAGHHVKSGDRQKNIDVTLGLIQKHFTHKEPPLLGHGPGLSLDFENSLRRSKIETSRYEFKQGLYKLSAERERDNELVSRVAEVLCSIANIGPNSVGYIYFGVADNKDDADRIRNLDGVINVKIGDVYVVGIDREAKLKNQSVEIYVRNLIAELRKTDLAEPLKSDVLSAVDTIQYRSLSVVRLTIPSQKRMSWVGESTFIREGSETKQATGRQVEAITERFQS